MYNLVFCTVDNTENAQKIAKAVVENKLAACVNIINGISSIYTWKSQIVEDKEILLLIKTKKVLFDSLKSKIKELHPYEVPEIIGVDIQDGLKSYLDWIDFNTTENL